MRAARKNKEGSVLLIVIVMSAILSIATWYTMKYTLTELRQTTSSIAWVQAFHTAEAGVSVAIDEFRKSTATNYAAWTGWPAGSGAVHTLPYTPLDPAGHDAVESEYTVTVDTNLHTITSTGRVPGVGGAPPVTRTIFLALDPALKSPFTQGILVKDTIDISGGLTLDAFDSSDTNKSTGGMFDPAKATTNCSIVALSTDTNAIRATGSGQLNGDANTAPGGGVSLSGGFTITGGSSATASNEIDAVYVPISTTLTDPGINNNTTIVVAGSRDMAVPIINLTGGQKLNVTGYGVLRLYVDGVIDFTGHSELIITPDPPTTNLTVQIYANGDVRLGGGGVVNNSTSAANLQIYGTPNCSSVIYSGSSEFKGVINAPNADVSLSGSSGFTGAVIGGEVTLSGDTHFIYDEALAGLKSDRIIAYRRSAWREL